MRRYAFSLLCLWLGSVLPATAEELPFAYQADYRIEHEGMHVGRLRVDLQPVGGGVWRYRSATEPQGLFAMFSGTRIQEISYLETHEGRLRNLAYSYEDGRDARDKDLHSYFDWQKRRLLNSRGDQAWQAELPAESFDRHALTLALANALRKPSTTLEFSVVEKGELKSLRFETRGEETLSLPYKTLRAVKLEEVRPPGKRHTLSWHAPELAYLPVRIEQHRKGKLVTRLSLESFSRR